MTIATMTAVTMISRRRCHAYVFGETASLILLRAVIMRLVGVLRTSCLCALPRSVCMYEYTAGTEEKTQRLRSYAKENGELSYASELLSNALSNQSYTCIVVICWFVTFLFFLLGWMCDISGTIRQSPRFFQWFVAGSTCLRADDREEASTSRVSLFMLPFVHVYVLS